MSFCSICGNKVSDTTKFCSNCGNEIKRGESIIPPKQHSDFQAQSLSKSSFKNLSYVKYMVLAVIVFAAFFFYNSGSGKNKYDSDGNKHGEWVEYIDEIGSEEVAKESASYIRKLEFNHGVPVGLARDFYPNGKLQCEFYLISQPYTKNGERPADNFKGLVKWFDENTKIEDWMYYDDNGDRDMEKYILMGIDEIKEDSRFDEAVFKEKYQVIRDRRIELEKEIRSNDEMPPTGSEDEIGNSTENYNNQSSNPSTQNLNKRCNHCYGTGKCPSCKGPFTVHYWGGYGWKDRNEYRPGYVICRDCRGAGVIYTGGWDYNASPKQPLSKSCYVSGCINGWLFCKECNYSGNGNNLGICKECKGTGLSKYQY